MTRITQKIGSTVCLGRSYKSRGLAHTNVYQPCLRLFDSFARSSRCAHSLSLIRLKDSDIYSKWRDPYPACHNSSDIVRFQPEEYSTTARDG
jgi:hypothetical protein